MGFLTIYNPIKKGTLKSSLSSFYSQLKRIQFSSVLVTFLFGASLFGFFLTNIDYASGSYLILGGMVGTLFAFLYLENRIWNDWIGKMKLTLDDFEEEVE